MWDEACMEEKEATLMNPLQLAYMGDSVWEMMVRSHLIQRGFNLRHLHGECIQRVNAGAQARFLEALLPLLTESEKEIVRRGRNAHAKHPSPKHQDPGDYAESTGFEALLGFLYLTGNQVRLRKIGELILGEEKDHG